MARKELEAWGCIVRQARNTAARRAAGPVTRPPMHYDTVLALATLCHDTAVGPATQRVEARGEARRGAGHGTRGIALRGARVRAAIRLAQATIRPGQAATRRWGVPRYGHVRSPRRGLGMLLG